MTFERIIIRDVTMLPMLPMLPMLHMLPMMLIIRDVTYDA